MAATAGLVGALGCSTDSILTVERPDIIDPGKLGGTTGAAALYAGAIGEVAFAQAGVFGGFMLLSGLFSDEFRFGGTPPEVREMDLGFIRPENSFAPGDLAQRPSWPEGGGAVSGRNRRDRRRRQASG
jgi:hypothetical protein